MREAWIVDAVRTPRGKRKKDSGALAGIHPQELLAQCSNAPRDRTPASVTLCIGGGMGTATVLERMA